MKKLLTLVLIIANSIQAQCCTSTITIAATAPASDTVCAGATIKFTATVVANGGTNPVYQWMVNGVVVGTNSATYTYTPFAGDGISCTLFNTCGLVTSNTLFPIVKPVLNEKPAQFFCGGYTTSPISLYGASWTNSNATIGLSANGTGDIPAFNAVNTGSTPITAIITAIQTCSVTDTAVFPIIINPIPTVDSVSNQNFCAGSSTAVVNFSGPVPYTAFNWTSSNTTIGLAASGADSIPSFTAINNGTTPIIDTITVTPLTSGFAYMTDYINGFAYSVSRATNSQTASISGVGSFFDGTVGISTSTDGQWVYIANNGDGWVTVINAATDTITAIIPVGANPIGIVTSPDGKYVYVADTGSGFISVISTAIDTVTATINMPAGTNANNEGLAISPDGSRLYVTGSTDPGMVYFINTATNLVFDSVTVGSYPTGIIVSPDGAKVYVANTNGLNISTILVSTKQVTTSAAFTTNNPGMIMANGLALSPDGLTLYVSSFWDGTVTYYNTATNPPTLVNTITLPGGGYEGPVGLSMSADGLFLYVSNAGEVPMPPNYSTLEVINTATKTVVSSDTIVNPDGEEVSWSFGNFVTGISCNGTPITFTITINPNGAAAVNLAITNGSQNSYSGLPVTYTATPINAGANPTYNFKINGTSVQNGTSATYTSSTLINNDTITCVITGNGCGGLSTNTSNAIVMTVNPALIDSVSIAANTTGAICAGTPVTFTATPTNGGNNPNYNFTVNGASVQNGTSATYTTNQLHNNDVVNVIMTSNATGVIKPIDTATGVIISVLPVADSVINKTICSGQSFDGHNGTGTFIDTFKSVNGCDSVRTLNLTLLSVTNNTITQAICKGQSFDGHDSAGIFIDTLLATGGCDSVIRTLNLSIITRVLIESKQDICPGQNFEGHTTAGSYFDTIFSTGGCDSIVFKVELDVTPLTSDTVYDTIFKGQTYAGYNNAGEYIDTFTVTGGCDSIRTLFLTVKDSILGIASINNVEAELNLFPNPASTNINLSATFEIDSYTVFNPEGQEIARKENIKTTQATIDLQGWAKGVYFIQTIVGRQVIVKRFTVL